MAVDIGVVSLLVWTALVVGYALRATGEYTLESRDESSSKQPLLWRRSLPGWVKPAAAMVYPIALTALFAAISIFTNQALDTLTADNPMRNVEVFGHSWEAFLRPGIGLFGLLTGLCAYIAHADGLTQRGHRLALFFILVFVLSVLFIVLPEKVSEVIRSTALR